MRRARTRPTPTENSDALGVGPARVRRLAGGRGRAAHAAKQHGVGARAGSQRGRGQVLAARVPCRPADQSRRQGEGVPEARANGGQHTRSLRAHLGANAVAGAHGDFERRSSHADDDNGRFAIVRRSHNQLYIDTRTTSQLTHVQSSVTRFVHKAAV
jgi:hypothetical protein